MEPDAVELRILGCLIEKQRTTPDAYPLSLNALRLACNQTTNRDPVVQYDEATIRDALQRLYRRRWTRLAGAGRAAKYRHLLDEALGLSDDELALLAVLMLRGPQTPGELNQRVARLHPFAGIEAVHATLERLVGRELVERLPRRPGQKEERYVQRLGEEATAVESRTDAVVETTAAAAERGAAPGADARIEALEREVADLRRQVEALRAELGYDG
ncbi:MAG TPA: YceH family protein [Capillimicrobium sp.]|nr:YceH family protein [Capillimicrobium sp.]